MSIQTRNNMFKLMLLAQLCLATVSLSLPSASTSKGVKRDIASPGSIANLFARDDDLYYNQYPGYAGGYGYSYGYYPRATDVISPLYYNDGYGTGWGYGAGLGRTVASYPYYYSAWPGYYGYNRYRYGGYGAGVGYGLGGYGHSYY
ncbi:prisilkin-39-like [Phymastichus coffea]|uniref:prisilkin-39-like n=1 Tax=Phymastichus coffea TaxID=108790 RepID=UPI00273CA79F|nr:prisilkin-39-like [Phymastichus coffea]XP_058788803.1 prisilkin-39-like [Phymastichus coffea]